MSDQNSEVRMPTGMMRWILVFLFLYFMPASYLMWTVWNAVPLEGPPSTVAGEASEPNATLRIDSVSPGAFVPVGDPVGVLIYGQGFDEGTTVLVNGDPAQAGRALSPGRIYVALDDAEQASGGRLAISLRSAATPPVMSNVAVIHVADGGRARVLWHFWFFGDRTTDISQETRFLLLTLLVGSLGGVLASFNSMAIVRGEERLFVSWATHYVVSPFVAGGIAMFLYFTIRAGFLSGTAVMIEPGALPWGLLSVAALSGLFYDRSFLKLREVFLTLFRADDSRGGKIEVPTRPKPSPDSVQTPDEPVESDIETAVGSSELAIAKTNLPPAKAGMPYIAQVEAEDAPAGLSWSVTPDLPGGLQLHPGTGVISGTPPEEAETQAYVFTVEDLAGRKASAGLYLEVRP